MTRTSLSLATVYSSAQCVLSVVGSVGVILLFAGIPQLIYSPVVSVGNLMTFLMGALLITTMVAGNSFLNYKYRSLERLARERRRSQERQGGGPRRGSDPEDKPPSYDAIITSDGLPPDYFTILPEKPPRYEEITSEMFALTTLPPPPALSPPSPLTTTISTTPPCRRPDDLTIIPDTSTSTSTSTLSTTPCPGEVSVTSSSFGRVEVGNLQKVSQKKCTGVSRHTDDPMDDRISHSREMERRRCEDHNKEEKDDSQQEGQEYIDKANNNRSNYENMDTDEHINQETKEGREVDTERIWITDATVNVKDRSECVSIKSLSSVSQNSTHLNESET